MNEPKNGNQNAELAALVPEVSTGAVALEAVDRAAIDMQIATAKAYPRSITNFRREAMELACLDEDTAASMFYAIPRGGKQVEGPSIRLAEIAQYSWGNIRVDARIMAVELDRVIAVGTAFDCERNSGSRVEIPRSIMGSKGRFNADMINVTCRAAIAIARREAILAVIPRAYINPIYHAARKASLGEGGTTEKSRQNALAWFGKLGVEAERVFALLNVKGIDDIGEDELILLRGLKTAIQDGETSVDQAFGRPGSEPGQADELNAAIEKTENTNGGEAPEPAASGDGAGSEPGAPAVAAPPPDDGDAPPEPGPEKSRKVKGK